MILAPPRRRLLLLSLVAGAAFASEPPRPDVARLVRSTVCVVGRVPGGTFASSGFVVPPGDVVLTTAHGIGAASSLRVKLEDGRLFPARLERLGDERFDLALLSIPGVALEPVALGAVADLSRGDEVLTIGCPLGYEFSVTRGVVSSIRPSDLGYPLIQTDVPVNPGSSGGPLFDREGRVVGIVKAAANDRERIHLALPIDLGTALLGRIANERRANELFNEAVLAARSEEKAALYRKALAADPELFEAHYNLGLVLARGGAVPEAERHYREALRLRPGDPAAALNLGVLLQESGRSREAVEAYRTALRVGPGSPALRNNLAEAYRAAGDARAARREYEALIAARPDYAPAHYGLAVLLDDEVRDRKGAARHYRRYLALAPEASDAEQVREWLARAERGERAEGGR